MDNAKKCEHKWRKSGLWDGRTAEGKRTGGIVYKCNLCGEEATTMQQIKEKGGSVIQGTDIYGKPINIQKNDK